MNIDEMTVGELKQVAQLAQGFLDCKTNEVTNKYKFKIGEKICIRTVTMIFTGIVENDYDDFVSLSSACWVADSGRWSKFLEDPNNVNEAEMYPSDAIVRIAKGAFIDFCVIPSIIMETK